MHARSALYFCLILLLAVLAGCSSSGKRSGGYYQNDGPGSGAPDINAIPNAIPRIEAYAPANFRPYSVFGRRYVPISGNVPFREEGIASWYGRQFHGNKTANGEIYDMYAMTAAHPTLPIPSYAKVTRPATGRTIVVRINDRGPFHPGRIIDLSYVAAAKLGLIGPGSGKVVVEAITHTDISRGSWNSPGTSATVAQAPVIPVASTVDVARASLINDTEPVMTPIVPDALAAIELTTMANANDEAADTLSAVPASGDSSRVTDMPAVPAAGAGFYLQFGAFGSEDNALALAQKLNTLIAGQENNTVHVSLAANLYRVQLGPYIDRTHAVNAAVRLYDLIGMNPAIASR
ncbi:MAG: septal ring lytic transglycosylase RlpA family protein [Alcaligenaceae bacterium]|nr:septal ring lytic transglycosylase RlpA family protein [Alcaligenaceae bacterium]